MKKIALIVALALAVFVVPAAAKDHPGQGKPAAAEHGKSADAPHGKSRKCTPHNVAYVVAGTLDSGTLTKNDDGTYSGDLTVKVARANHHAKADKGTSKTYTLDHAKVNLHGQDPAALTPDSRVRLQGKVTWLAKKCDQTGFTATTTIRRGWIKDPKTADQSSTTDSTGTTGTTPAS
ncbi:MAG: hypothetical protein ACXVFK_10615 [Solirubrobacteraceae bacterium]